MRVGAGRGRDSGARKECASDAMRSAVQVGGDVERDVICRRGASAGRRPTPVATGLDMGKRWLLNVMRRVVTSPLSFPDDTVFATTTKRG